MKTPAIASTERPLSWVRIRQASAKLIADTAPRSRVAKSGAACDR